MYGRGEAFVYAFMEHLLLAEVIDPQRRVATYQHPPLERTHCARNAFYGGLMHERQMAIRDLVAVLY